MHHQNISDFHHIGCCHFDGRHPDLHKKAKYRACNANHDAWRTDKEDRETRRAEEQGMAKPNNLDTNGRRKRDEKKILESANTGRKTYMTTTHE